MPYLSLRPGERGAPRERGGERVLRARDRVHVRVRLVASRPQC